MNGSQNFLRRFQTSIRIFIMLLQKLKICISVFQNVKKKVIKWYFCKNRNLWNSKIRNATLKEISITKLPTECWKMKGWDITTTTKKQTSNNEYHCHSEILKEKCHLTLYYVIRKIIFLRSEFQRYAFLLKFKTLSRSRFTGLTFWM